MLKGFAFVILGYIIYYAVMIIYDLFKKPSSNTAEDVAEIFAVDGADDESPPPQTQLKNYGIEDVEEVNEPTEEKVYNIDEPQTDNTETSHNTEAYQMEANIIDDEEEKLLQEYTQHSEHSNQLDQVAEQSKQTKSALSSVISESLNYDEKDLKVEDRVFISRTFKTESAMQNFLNNEDTHVTVEKTMEDGTLVFKSAS